MHVTILFQADFKTLQWIKCKKRKKKRFLELIPFIPFRNMVNQSAQQVSFSHEPDKPQNS